MTETSAARRPSVPVKGLLLLVIGAVLGAVATVAAYVVVDVSTHSWALYDEWQCNQGWVPAVNTAGGTACRPAGARLAKGEHWDPLGNRPIECEGRDGWVQVESDRGGTLDCFTASQPIPDGWHRFRG